MTTTRDNHYVPEWYQKGFLSSFSNQLHYLDLTPDNKTLSDGRVITMNDHYFWPTSQCFYQTDLYTTFFGKYINDEVERKLFGNIDNTGAKAVRAFINEDISEWHDHFSDFFSYIDSQKIRTPKSLQWIKKHYPKLDQIELMCEMQAIRNRHCTIWSEGIREIVSATTSNTKFIISDHPVTIYNQAYPPENELCAFPNDPSIALKGTQTIFPLDMDHCLILTNYEYAKNPDIADPTEKRTYALNFRESIARTDAFIRTRSLNEEDVRKINFIIKTRARRYIAASEKDWLYPENTVDWSKLGEVLLPPDHELFHFGGEVYVGYKDGSSSYQDAFGRTSPENKYLKKSNEKNEPRPNDQCGCGSGIKYKKCCRNKSESERPSWKELSIRERNLIFCNGVSDILGFTKNKTWDDVRRELNNEQVKKIHELYGFLWPVETDITSLLPKPDKSLRAVYTGIIDPRVISEFATGLTLYFDEIIIQSPFVNPASINPKYSPLDAPHQYKQQTLKNVMLLLTLAPFIDAGYINFIPDPCVFDRYLQRQMFSMAEERAKNYKTCEQEQKLMEALAKDDFERSMFMFPKAQRKNQIHRDFPNLSEEQIEEMFEYIEKKKRDDPFTLLQEDVYKEDGQLTMMNLTPNFEISLFLSQITGSFILTDSHYRWREITASQNKEGGTVIYNWSDISSCINDLEYALNKNPERVFQLRNSGKLGESRKAFRDIYSCIQEEVEPAQIEIQSERIKKKFIEAIEISKKEIGHAEQHSFKGKFHCIIPKGGIAHNNVQRMLLSCGVDNHLNNVPMAIFVSAGAST